LSEGRLPRPFVREPAQTFANGTHRDRVIARPIGAERPGQLQAANRGGGQAGCLGRRAFECRGGHHGIAKLPACQFQTKRDRIRIETAAIGATGIGYDSFDFGADDIRASGQNQIQTRKIFPGNSPPRRQSRIHVPDQKQVFCEEGS